MAEITFLSGEEEEDKVSGVEMMVTTMETITGTSIVMEPRANDGPWNNHNNNNGQGGYNSNNGSWGYINNNQGQPGNKQNVPDTQPAVVNPETHPMVIASMGAFLTRFNGVHLNKILEIQ